MIIMGIYQLYHFSQQRRFNAHFYAPKNRSVASAAPTTSATAFWKPASRRRTAPGRPRKRFSVAWKHGEETKNWWKTRWFPWKTYLEVTGSNWKYDIMRNLEGWFEDEIEAGTQMQTFYGVLRWVFPIFRSLEFQLTSWTRSSPRSPRERIHSPWCFFWNQKKPSAIFPIFPNRNPIIVPNKNHFPKNSNFLYHLVMTNSSPWYRWPIEIDGLPIKNGGSFHGELLVITRPIGSMYIHVWYIC